MRSFGLAARAVVLSSLFFLAFSFPTRRQLASSLHLQFSKAGGALHVSNANWSCKAYTFNVTGGNPPYNLATVPWSTGLDSTTNQSTAQIGNLTIPQVVEWTPDLLTWCCRNLHAKGWEALSRTKKDAILGCSITFGVLGLVILIVRCCGPPPVAPEVVGAAQPMVVERPRLEAPPVVGAEAQGGLPTYTEAALPKHAA
ncbi:hypothetical protein JCM10207_002492 [Rhodosporidiobolus poonsookiae]